MASDHGPPVGPTSTQPARRAQLDGAMVPCVSIDWPYLRRSMVLLLPVIFLPLSAADAVASVVAGWLGTDAYLYYRASAAWLHGGNPWDVFVTNQTHVYHYQALPTTTVILAPLTVLPENVFVAAWIVLQLLAAAYTVRRLGLPWWWIAFPPMANGILAGNPSPLLLALLVTAHPLAKALAPLLKVYAVVPLLGEGRWRTILISAVLGSLTIAIAPHLWAQFVAGAGGRTDLLLTESKGGYSAFGNTLGMVGAVAALILIARRDLRAAAWLAPIALWPGSQFHWSTLAMPLISLPMSAAMLPMAYLLALPAHGLPPAAVMIYAVVGEARSYLAGRRDGPAQETQAAG
jgi:hypothetical protein